MNQANEDTLRDEYDFSKSVRGKHHEPYRKGTNVVLLEADVAEAFKDSASVNKALRTIAQLARDHAENMASQ